jgi:hypothetical protein
MPAPPDNAGVVSVALARATLCALLPVGLLWAAVDTRRHSVQDLLLRTAVVYDWATPEEPPRSADRSNGNAS